MNSLEIEGWVVAKVELERSWSGRELPDSCRLFRSSAAWTLLTVRRDVRYRDQDQPVGGRAVVRTAVFGSLEELAGHVEDAYTAGSWVELLDAGSENDAELYRAWVPERVRRDFDGASLHVKDLALYTGLFGGRPVPAPGRQLAGWEDLAVARMVEHLVELGFEVLDDQPVVRVVDADGDPPPLGALRVRRYGWETVGVVRVDDVGEVFVRVPDPSEVEGVLWQPEPHRSLRVVSAQDVTGGDAEDGW